MHQLYSHYNPIKSLYIYIPYDVPMFFWLSFHFVSKTVKQECVYIYIIIYIYPFARCPRAISWFVNLMNEYEFVISTINLTVSSSPTFSSKVFSHLKPHHFSWFDHHFSPSPRVSPGFSTVFRQISPSFSMGKPPRLAAAAWSAPANNPRRWSPGPQGPQDPAVATVVSMVLWKTAH